VIYKLKQRWVLMFLIFSILTLSIVFTKPLLEDWGIISWFRNAPPDFAMWTTWIKNTFNGTPARPFQIIAWVTGIQVGKLQPFNGDTEAFYNFEMHTNRIQKHYQIFNLFDCYLSCCLA